jgi:chromosome segregation ATPase
MVKANAPTVNGHGAVVNGHDNKHASASQLDITLPAMDALSEELNRLAAINAELVGRLRGAAVAASVDKASGGDSAALDSLRHENVELRGRVEELEQLLVATATNEDSWADRQKEYEALLEEKSEVIRALHVKLHELQEGARRAPNEPVPKEEELQQLKQELEDQRRQLQEDEESLMTQMREMELALSRDRAELARQRQELVRLQAELNREIEQAGRDSGLRERLANIRRAHDTSKKDATPQPDGGKQQGSGLFRRLFG